jgi:hypothetical protein
MGLRMESRAGGDSACIVMEWVYVGIQRSQHRPSSVFEHLFDLEIVLISVV